MYEVELGHIKPELALAGSFEEVVLAPEQKEFAQRVVLGYFQNSKAIDHNINDYIHGYTMDRIAAIDRNVLRIAVYELFHEDAIPPAVTLNEAIEISKKYSTAESSKFVNGVLGSILKISPKAKWDPDTAPPEFEDEFDEELDETENLIEAVEEIVVEADSVDFKTAAKFGGWKLVSGDAVVPPVTDH